MELSKPVTNGLTYDFTFTFEKAGETTVAVPISAGEAPFATPVNRAAVIRAAATRQTRPYREIGCRHGRQSLRLCRSRRLPSRRGPGQFENAFAVPLLGMPAPHRQVGGPLPGVRHLGHGR